MSLRPSHLTVGELSAAFRLLSREDILRLRKIAAKYSAGIAMNGDDLVNEAIFRALDGARKCPRDLHVLRFLAGVMKSVAWAARQGEKTDPLTGAVDIHDPAGLGAKKATEEIQPDQRMDAQRRYKELQQTVLDLFENDEEAQLVILGQFDEMSSGEIKQEFGLDDRQFATIRRRIRRRIDIAFPEGWKQ